MAPDASEEVAEDRGDLKLAREQFLGSYASGWFLLAPLGFAVAPEGCGSKGAGPDPRDAALHLTPPVATLQRDSNGPTPSRARSWSSW